MKRKLLAGMTLVAMSGTLLAAFTNGRDSAPPPCRIQGVWNLVSIVFKGDTTPMSGGKQRMIVTKNHYMWVRMDSLRDTIPLRSALDSARHFAMSGGAGRYRLAGNKFIVQLEYYVDPKMVGKELTATCRTPGKRWYHTYRIMDLNATVEGVAQTDSVTEIFQRVE